MLTATGKERMHCMRHGLRTLTLVQARRVRALYASGEQGIPELVKYSGVSRNAVHRILMNITYYDPAYTPPTPTERRLMKNLHIARTAARKRGAA